MSTDHLIELRRDLHRHPEPAWREFYTTCRIVEEIERIGVTDLYVGREAIDVEERLAVPDSAELVEWFNRAREAGAKEDVLERLDGGYTGCVAVVERGEGPTIGLRVDIDGLLREESRDDEHAPAAEGFRSENEGAMHACGHDAHATIGLGVLEAITESDFQGTLKVFFQPGEEMIAGGKAMAKSEHLADVEYLLALHIGLDHPTGEVVAGIDDFLAVSHLHAEFSGQPAHAGAEPDAGENAVQAMAAAIQNLYSIPRHHDGATRVNAGQVGGGTASNIVPESAYIEGEVRGQTTELMEYMRERADRVLEGAAAMHGCEVTVETRGEAPSARSDQQLVDVVSSVARTRPGVERVLERDALGGSEDATYLMQEVQKNGGYASYVGIGTDHPGGHHTATFDVDEESIAIGIDVISRSITEIAATRPE
ncbi:amidohydrolase [Halalkalicoccus jeotgali]|uniref:Indole-3-acetyl-L-aspartic acid hydrolase n=1 Tax=Halalkalicoccus jeotgali (strain DSM 18796 / CECT 7217 / JCM 14584 / KCTC 4019 / B3) TaxID=795797 RepID=D8J8C0_HALJB|nr:amidohydrolase [Halalkalicoccus jeotgali]ADJ16166.1 indole-3-acetyl-L-aspartic acid hydrolase [Halalkalicoccus jeotgali B3]ELY37595.1 indole-3-acetyl-L-aspartic acid hydrolase [Halalkalicoccus jeotgali B3]